MNSRFARALALVSAVSLLPLSTAAMSQVDAGSAREVNDILGVMQRIKAFYVDDVNDDQLIEGAISGMLSSLDPHSSYLNERAYEDLRTQTDGEYGGLGLTVTLEDDAVKVIAPTADTPADKAGIKSGDYITHLDGKLIYGGTLDDAVEEMRGEPGSDITLTIFRPGRDKPFDVTLTRAIIDLQPVKWDVQGDIGVITVTTFTDGAGQDVVEAMRSIQTKLGRKPLGYILDLRSNPGGLLDEAVNISDVFLNDGEIVSQRGRRRADTLKFFAKQGDYADGLPVIVLIDAGSASASEIVAGALQDRHRGLVMGERSFGKGSVQTIVPLTNDTGLRLTTARYYTPSGRSVQEGGIDPDIRVPQLSDPDYASRTRIRESDLRKHLINELAADDKTLEQDDKDDPRFSMTAEELEKQGIKDFQLHYALQTIGRLGKTAQARNSVPALKAAASARN
ncbi:MAG: S41 family peptidase [Novosphingopyxis baekryungensis]|jgi:carboxyl-terminal processing protease|uniref:S41 family peptidase n=1 Tax=Novosphingopyxis baekryungensis TaxID=279369 RepID=UPI0003B485E4|nr:S41 family peptidase [Novosphingopyxis baekryungensis]MDE0932037.1 S41 family peptidase [Novosphingopyxis baekryungensis]